MIRISIFFAIFLLPPAPSALAGTSVGGGTLDLLGHVISAVDHLGRLKSSPEKCLSPEERLRRYSNRLPAGGKSVGRIEEDSALCQPALGHALELEGLYGSSVISERAISRKHSGGAAEGDADGSTRAGTAPAN